MKDIFIYFKYTILICVFMEPLEVQLSDLRREVLEIKKILLSENKIVSTDELEDLDLNEIICADLFKALSNEERIKILKSLINGDQYFAQMKELTDLDHSPLRFHLTVLIDVNLVSQERFRGKYSITELGKQALIIASSFSKIMKKEGSDEKE